MIDWVELIKTIGGVIIAIIAAISSLIAVWKGKENKELKKKNEDKEENQEPTEGDKDNLWMTLANPYLKAVKHSEAAKDAKKKKKPVWVGPKSFRHGRVPKTVLEEGVEKNNRNLANFNMLNWLWPNHCGMRRLSSIPLWWNYGPTPSANW